MMTARRIEIGSGHRPRPGYIHVDYDATLPDLQILARADRLPIPSDWAAEIVAVHVLEHVSAQRLAFAIAEWRRVLRPGGALEVHVPNGLSVSRMLAETTELDQFWRLQNAIFGYWAGPADTNPATFPGSPDHKLLFTPAMLEKILSNAGFVRVENVSGSLVCEHQSAWSSTVPGLCLEVSAQK
jgi:SAM-dependent methyltransferase